MIPVLARVPEWVPLVGGQAITSFGALLLVAFLVAGRLFVRALRTEEPDARGWDLVVTAALAGVLGAKAMHLALNGFLGLPTALGRSGLHWFGGLAAGAAAVLWHARARGLHPRRVAGAAAAPVALGYAIGRIGSFLVGSEYGLPTTLPWGVAFPAGYPPTTPANLMAHFHASVPAGSVHGDFVTVHPTQLYEAALSTGIFVAVHRAWRRRNGSRMGGWAILGLFLTLHGAARGAVGPIRASAGLMGPLVVDLLLAAVVVGGLLLVGRRDAN